MAARNRVLTKVSINQKPPISQTMIGGLFTDKYGLNHYSSNSISAFAFKPASNLP